MGEAEKETGKEALVVSSRIKAMAKESGLRVSEDFVNSLDSFLRDVVLPDAFNRCRDNGRATLKPCDV